MGAEKGPPACPSRQPFPRTFPSCRWRRKPTAQGPWAPSSTTPVLQEGCTQPSPGHGRKHMLEAAGPQGRGSQVPEPFAAFLRAEMLLPLPQVQDQRGRKR